MNLILRSKCGTGASVGGQALVPRYLWLGVNVPAELFSAVRTRTQYVCGPIELSITDTTQSSTG